MKKTFKKFGKILGLILLGIILQSMYKISYGIIFLENLWWHERAYYVSMKMDKTDTPLRILKIQTTVHYSLGKNYIANIYLPEQYKVLNKKPNLGAEAIPGYKAYKMNMVRKYRDVKSSEDFVIAPVSLDMDISSSPVLVDFLNLHQSLHKDETYRLATLQQNTELEGPERAEATYPQKWGM